MTDGRLQFEAQGQERLYPSVSNPNWLVLRRRREIFHCWINAIKAQRISVLDVGGRIQPYRPLFDRGKVHYVSVDLRVTPLVSAVADADRLPFASCSFDVVICTQTLEYVEDPRRTLSEIYRVLKPEGVLLLSVPAIAPIDSINDRWRFLPAGVRELTSRYSTVEIVPEGSNIASFFRSVNVYLYFLATYRPFQALLAHTVVPLFNLLGLGLERLVRMNNSTFSTNYSVRAKR